jgi:uncharacterized membrane protein YsdA (DUF1294 family)
MFKPAASPYFFFYFLVFIIGGLIFGALTFYAQFNSVINYLIAVNGAILIVFAYDKMIAGGKNTRVPELVLYCVALLGGSIGLLLGMQLFRHKTRHVAFQLIAILIFLLQAVLIISYLNNKV